MTRVTHIDDGAVKAKTKKDVVVGLFVAKHIIRGQRIIDEEPLWSFPPGDITEWDAEALFYSLEGKEQYQIQNLHVPEIEGKNSLVSIFETHSILTEDGARRFTLSTAYMQHSCVPNAIVDWNAENNHITVHALRSLEPTEEITVSYINPLLPFPRRWELLNTEFDIDCLCIRCSPLKLYGDVIAREDRRICELEEILHLYEQTPREFDIMYYGHTALDFVRELMRLQRGTNAATPMNLTYRRASVYSMAAGNLEDAKKYAENGLSNSIECWGVDSPRTKEATLWRNNVYAFENRLRRG